MPRYVAMLEVPSAPEKVFQYLSDFHNTREWDPGVVEAERLTPGPTRQGTEFRIVTSLLGLRSELHYEITHFEPPRRVVLEAESPTVRSVDEIRFEPHGAGTRITYDADLRIKGLIGLPEALWQRIFDRIGARAVAGLRAHLGG